MAKIVFRLNGVPDDESEDVRKLLARDGIRFFETPAGVFGFSLAAFWVEDSEQHQRARKLIEEYEAARASAAREEYARRKAAGTTETLFHRVADRPLQVLFYLAVIGLVLYFSLKPFADFGK